MARNLHGFVGNVWVGSVPPLPGLGGSDAPAEGGAAAQEEVVAVRPACQTPPMLQAVPLVKTLLVPFTAIPLLQHNSTGTHAPPDRYFPNENSY